MPYTYGVCSFLPDFTEHPKPKRRKDIATINSGQQQEAKAQRKNESPVDSDDITFFHDFVAGGVAGCASVVVGHPFDTMKCRLQMSHGNGGLLQTMREFGGFLSLFRGLSAPLYAATAINALVFGSYGFSSRLYDEYISPPIVYEGDDVPTHDPWQKSWLCGSFAGAVQCVILCPIEHIKCRLQTQKGSVSGHEYTGTFQTGQKILSEHGLRRLYQGFVATFWREVPAFGLYFATYDYLKDRANAFFANNSSEKKHHHQWVASAFAGGCSGCITWAFVYPVDVAKTHIQTAPLNTPSSQLGLFTTIRQIVQRHGVGVLFRGLGITLVRAFPVNGTIFPVYEFTMQQIMQLGY